MISLKHVNFREPPNFFAPPRLILGRHITLSRRPNTSDDIMVVKKVIKLSIFVSNTWRYEDVLRPNTLILKMAIEIVDLPINIVIFHSFL